jgi:hypothetical protein
MCLRLPRRRRRLRPHRGRAIFPVA